MPSPRGPWPGRESVPRAPELRKEKYVEARLNQGMITVLDPADIPPSALQLAKNCVTRFDKTSRRPGSIALTPEPPNDDPVLAYAAIKKRDGTPYTIRMTPASVHVITGGVWVEQVGTLTGAITDRFNTAVVLNEFVFSNNGADEIQTIDFTLATFDQLGNAPKYRYLCGFYNRVVGAALADSDEVEIGWSGDGVITEWNPLVDESAGKGPLVESPADLSDFITGIFSWTNVMLVLREKSVWVATKQPIPQYPFAFRSVIPGIGCDCPASAINGGDALIWFDLRTSEVYAYSPGGAFEAIGSSIKRNLVASVDSPERVFSSYNPIHREYTLYAPQASSKIIPAWTYNRQNKAWCYNEFYDVTCANDIEIGSGGRTIDQLVGTIDELEGTINDLSSLAVTSTIRVYGYGDGNGGIEDVNASKDAPHTDHEGGYEYNTELESKVFTEPEDDLYIAEVRIEYQAQVGGTFTLEYSRVGGAGLNPWKNAKVINPTILGVPRLLRFKRVIKARRFAFRLVSTGGLFDILSYEIHVYRAGESTK